MSAARHSGDGFAGRGDDAYELLVAAHEGLDEAASFALNARLVLLLAHQVGDVDTLKTAVDAARRSLEADGSA